MQHLNPEKLAESKVRAIQETILPVDLSKRSNEKRDIGISERAQGKGGRAISGDRAVSSCGSAAIRVHDPFPRRDPLRLMFMFRKIFVGDSADSGICLSALPAKDARVLVSN